MALAWVANLVTSVVVENGRLFHIITTEVKDVVFDYSIYRYSAYLNHVDNL